MRIIYNNNTILTLVGMIVGMIVLTPSVCNAFIPRIPHYHYQQQSSSSSFFISPLLHVVSKMSIIEDPTTTTSKQPQQTSSSSSSIASNVNHNNNHNSPPVTASSSDVNIPKHNHQQQQQQQASSSSKIGTTTKQNMNNSPIVVSEQSEALSHSTTTMKLIPSYRLFQLLSDTDDGVTIPEPNIGNYLRHSYTTTHDTIDDPYSNLQLSQFIEFGGTMKIEQSKLPDPFTMVEQEIQPFSDSIKELVSSDQPILSMAAKHFFEKRHGKRFRPTIVQLVAKMVASVPPESYTTNNHNNDTSSWEWSGASDTNGIQITLENHKGSDVWRKQAQLGQIVEMIHVASLIHDDVLDEADTRRGGESIHKLYSNKVAVLAGDYLLARASVLLARLENTAVVQIMSTALESLVAGEIMQLKSTPQQLVQMETYLRKSYCKTASLICYACRSTALLGGHSYGSAIATACEEFGFHLGLAYQIQDDILDFTAAASVLGKPALADMDLGLSTAPILYVAQEQPKIKQLIMRRFKEKGDKQMALEALYQSPTAMKKAQNLAQFHAQRAIDALLRIPPSEARNALLRLTHTVITRKK